MPILINLSENKVIGPYVDRAKQEARHEGAITVLRLQMEKRFGALPAWADERLVSRSVSELEILAARLASCPASELEDLSLRVLDASTLQDLLK